MRLARAIGIAALVAAFFAPAAQAQFLPDGMRPMPASRKPALLLTSLPSPSSPSSITPQAGPAITCARGSTATYIDSGGTRQTAAINTCVVESVTASGPGAGGTPMLRSEGPSTNDLLHSSAPATQTTASLSNGSYTGWVEGTGSLAFTAGTAVTSGLPCTATAGSTHDCHFSITTAGTIVATVTGTLTAEQLEPLPARTSYIPTVATVVARSADAHSITKPSSVNLTGGSWSESATATLEITDATKTTQCLMGSPAPNLVAAICPIVTPNTVDAMSQAASSPRATVVYADSNKTSSHKYTAIKTGTTLNVYVDGTAPSQLSTTVGAQPAEPTTLSIGVASTFVAYGWISAMCLDSRTTRCAP